MSTPGGRPGLHDVSAMAINLRSTEDALDSAALLLGMIGPRYRELDPAGLQVVDPSHGTLSDRDAATLLAALSDDIAAAAELLRVVHAKLAEATDRAERVYPRA